MKTSQAKLLILLAAALVVAVGAKWLFGAERRIWREVSRVEEAIAKSGAETELEAFSRSRTVSEIFAPSFEVRAPAFGFNSSDRRTVAGQVHLYRAQSETIAVEVFDRELAIDGGRAEMRISVSFSGRTLGGLSAREVFRFRLSWVKESGWKVSELELLEVVEDGGRSLF